MPKFIIQALLLSLVVLAAAAQDDSTEDRPLVPSENPEGEAEGDMDME